MSLLPRSMAKAAGNPTTRSAPKKYDRQRPARIRSSAPSADQTTAAQRSEATMNAVQIRRALGNVTHRIHPTSQYISGGYGMDRPSGSPHRAPETM